MDRISQIVPPDKATIFFREITPAGNQLRLIVVILSCFRNAYKPADTGADPRNEVIGRCLMDINTWGIVLCAGHLDCSLRHRGFYFGFGRTQFKGVQGRPAWLHVEGHLIAVKAAFGQTQLNRFRVAIEGFEVHDKSAIKRTDGGERHGTLRAGGDGNPGQRCPLLIGDDAPDQDGIRRKGVVGIRAQYDGHIGEGGRLAGQVEGIRCAGVVILRFNADLIKARWHIHQSKHAVGLGDDRPPAFVTVDVLELNGRPALNQPSGPIIQQHDHRRETQLGTSGKRGQIKRHMIPPGDSSRGSRCGLGRLAESAPV